MHAYNHNNQSTMNSSSSPPIEFTETPRLVVEPSPPKPPMKDTSENNNSNNNSHSSSSPHSDKCKNGCTPLDMHNENRLSTTRGSTAEDDDDEHDGDDLVNPSPQGHHQDSSGNQFFLDNDEEEDYLDQIYLDQMQDLNYQNNIHDELQRELDEQMDQALQEQLDQQMEEYFRKHYEDECAYYEKLEQELLQCPNDSEEEEDSNDDFSGLYSKNWGLCSKNDDDDSSASSADDCGSSDSNEDNYQRSSDLGVAAKRLKESSTDQLLERLCSLQLEQATTTTTKPMAPFRVPNIPAASAPCPSSFKESTTPVVTVQQINAEIQQVIDKYKKASQGAAKEGSVDSHPDIGDMTTSIDEETVMTWL